MEKERQPAVQGQAEYLVDEEKKGHPNILDLSSSSLTGPLIGDVVGLC